MSDLFDDDDDGQEIIVATPTVAKAVKKDPDPVQEVEVEEPEYDDEEHGVSFRLLLDRDYRAYAMHTIGRRAIPCMIDGMKPVQRMLYHAMQTLYKTGEVKCSEVAGTLPSFDYEHGEVSAQDAVVLMAKDWCNNLPFFIGHGNFGSRAVHESAAPRYIYVSNNPNASAVFKDPDALPWYPDTAVPQHYLPIIPTVLVNGTEGVAVGFATKIMMRSLTGVAKMVEEYLKTGEVKTLAPLEYPNFKGKLVQIDPRKFEIHGVIEQGTGKRSNSYTISELPFKWDRKSYVEFLAQLVEDDIITDFNDNCGKGGFSFIVKLNPKQRESAEKVGIMKTFDLIDHFTENYTLIDENGNLKIFDSVQDIVKHFCDYRVAKRQQQIDFDIDKLQCLIAANEAKQKFIAKMIEIGVSEVSKWKLKQLKDFIDGMGYAEYTQQLINIPIYGFTIDEIQDLESKTEKLRREVNSLRSTTATKTLLKEIAQIKG